MRAVAFSLITMRMARFESSLERDFYVLLQFNSDALRWDPQPVRLGLGSGLGTYVPDVLVSYAEAGPTSRRHVLYEVKYREELKRCWTTLRPRYRQAPFGSATPRQAAVDALLALLSWQWSSPSDLR